MPIELEDTENFSYVSPNNKVDYVIIRSLLHLSQISAQPAHTILERMDKYLNVRDLLVLDLAPLVYPKITNEIIKTRYHELIELMFDEKYLGKTFNPDSFLKLLQEFRFILSNTLSAAGLYEIDQGTVDDLSGYVPKRGRPPVKGNEESSDIEEI